MSCEMVLCNAFTEQYFSPPLLAADFKTDQMSHVRGSGKQRL